MNSVDQRARPGNGPDPRLSRQSCLPWPRPYSTSVPGTARIAQFRPPPTPPLSQPSPPCLKTRARPAHWPRLCGPQRSRRHRRRRRLLDHTGHRTTPFKVTARRTVPGPLRKLVRHRVGHGARTCARPKPPSSDRPSTRRRSGSTSSTRLLQCEPLPCFDQQTQLDLEKTGPGAFRLINIDGSKGGTSPDILADWMLNGYDGYMPLDWYFSDPGAKFDSSHIQSALDARIGTESSLPGLRRYAEAGLELRVRSRRLGRLPSDGLRRPGNSGKLDGYFTHVVWEGIQGERATDDDFGARSVALVE